MPKANTHKLMVRLAPKTTHRICDELSVTQTAAKILIDDESIPIQTRDKIALIAGHIDHVAWIGRQLLIVTGHCEVPHSVLDIGELLAEIKQLIQRLSGNDILLKMSLGSGVWPIKADFHSLESILCSLVANARDAMPDGGTICIRTSNITKTECESKPRMASIAADYALLEFTDTGIGIPERDVDRIFEPFFTTKGQGCGFGLATVYSAIKKMNGHIIVDSRVGHGTTFRFLFPRHTFKRVTDNSRAVRVRK